MTANLQQRRLKLVDQTLTTMGLAGYDLSESDIRFVWQVGLGKVEQDEIDDWTHRMAAKLDGNQTRSAQVWLNIHSAMSTARLAIDRMAKTIAPASS